MHADESGTVRATVPDQAINDQGRRWACIEWVGLSPGERKTNGYLPMRESMKQPVMNESLEPEDWESFRPAESSVVSVSW